MAQKAFLLTESRPSQDDRNICKLLDFFGIPYQVLTFDELTVDRGYPENMSGGKYCIFGDALLISKAIEFINSAFQQLPALIKAAHSVYVYNIDASSACKKLIKFVTGDQHADITRHKAVHNEFVISGKDEEFCGPMSGLRIPLISVDTDVAFQVPSQGESLRRLISLNSVDVYIGIVNFGVHFFLSTCDKIIDIESAVKGKYFDVKDYFLNAVPIVMYIRWAFRDIIWRSKGNSACLIVDDPVLKPKYGFFEFQKILGLMDAYKFSTNIAFIPWNWKRTKSSVANLFGKYPEKYSLSIHGCDHIGGEFGDESTNILNARIKLAKRRMSLHQEKTGCRHDSIMVFPQGVFSEESLRVLKHNNFMAAVNTEVTPYDSTMSGIEIRELWDLAIMKYETFPLLSRRYPEQGIENFAFDILLGKPCLIVTHHEFFKNNYRDLIEFIDRLNSLNCNLYWRGLGEVITKCYKEQNDVSGNIFIKMYCSYLRVENAASEPKTHVFIKKENNADTIKKVEVNGNNIEWRYEGDYVRFSAVLPSSENNIVNIEYFDVLGDCSYNFSAGYIIKNYIRRYLSEVRDNYLCKNVVIYNYLSKLKQCMFKH